MTGTREPAVRGPTGHAREVLAAMTAAVDPARLRRDVERLPAPRSRLHWPAEMARADALIGERFERHGWEVEQQPFVFEDAAGNHDVGQYPDGRWGPATFPRLEGRNVVALRRGCAAPDEAVVVGAHHDVVRDSRGADDNSSGVAGLLEIARLLAGVRLRRSVVLAAFDMEEIGRFGSRHFVSAAAGRWQVVAAVVLEMLAYVSHEPGSQVVPPGFGLLYRGQVRRIRRMGDRGDFLAVLFQRSSREAAVALAARTGTAGVRTVLLREPRDVAGLGFVLRKASRLVGDFARSDHLPFWDAGVPAVLLTDTAEYRNPHYHRWSDTPATLDYRHLARVVAATAATVCELAGPVRPQDTA